MWHKAGAPEIKIELMNEEGKKGRKEEISQGKVTSKSTREKTRLLGEAQYLNGMWSWMRMDT